MEASVCSTPASIIAKKFQRFFLITDNKEMAGWDIKKQAFWIREQHAGGMYALGLKEAAAKVAVRAFSRRFAAHLIAGNLGHSFAFLADPDS